ncbi:MAG: hypothetical protein JWN96_141 [Mycobacterium sp.]|nr:hypothetical protein [Mycobacterium sp.]
MSLRVSSSVDGEIKGESTLNVFLGVERVSERLEPAGQRWKSAVTCSDLRLGSLAEGLTVVLSRAKVMHGIEPAPL